MKASYLDLNSLIICPGTASLSKLKTFYNSSYELARSCMKSFHTGCILPVSRITTILATSHSYLGGLINHYNSTKSIFLRELRPVSAVYSAFLSSIIFSSGISDSITFNLVSKWVIILSFTDSNAAKCTLSIHFRTSSSLGSSKKGRSS